MVTAVLRKRTSWNYRAVEPWAFRMSGVPMLDLYICILSKLETITNLEIVKKERRLSVNERDSLNESFFDFVNNWSVTKTYSRNISIFPTSGFVDLSNGAIKLLSWLLGYWAVGANAAIEILGYWAIWLLDY